MESAACAGEKWSHDSRAGQNNQLIWFGIFSVEKETQMHTNIDLESQTLWKSVYKLHIEVKDREST